MANNFVFTTIAWVGWRPSVYIGLLGPLNKLVFRKTDGILLAYKARQIIRPKPAQSARTQIILITMDSVEHNVEMPKDRFELPPAIQALLKESKQAP